MRQVRLLGVAGVLALAGCSAAAQTLPSPSSPSTPPVTTTAAPAGPTGPTVLAFVADYGNCDAGAQAVADMVDSWDVEAVVTGGDNSQEVAGCTPFEESVEDVYGDYFADLSAPRFFPALGNHDYEDENAGLAAYSRTFPYLPKDADPHGRWYEKTLGNVTFFMLDSDAPPGDQTAQIAWVEEALGASRERDPDLWRIVVAHRSPFSSGPHGSWEAMQPAAGWEFQEWGADLVLSGHQHIYEDVLVDGMHYLTVTTGASATARECPEQTIDGSRGCIEGTGALRLEATADDLLVELHLLDEGAETLTDSIELTR